MPFLLLATALTGVADRFAVGDRRTEGQPALEVIDDDAEVRHDRFGAEGPVVGPEVHVGATVANDGEDNVDQLAVAASSGRRRIQYAIAAE